METNSAEEEFITIVPVGENKPPVLDPSFVTVLTVGVAGGAAEIIVQRPKGARLGLGLKFEGGSAASEKVRRLLVQSCADDSPAANATAPWGKLIPGDEILAIDGISVSELTRIDCVRRLKDSDEKLILVVRHFETNDKMDIKMLNEKEAPITTALVNEITRPTSLPPPVPPRKLGKKNSFKDKTTLTTVGEQNALINIDQRTENLTSGHNTKITKLSRKSSFDSHLFRQNKESLACLKKGSPEEVRRLVRRLSDGKAIPPEAEVYIDLLSNEWERCLALADAESDDTGSSISTVIDRLGSMANSVENSIPSTPIMQPKSIDIQKVLNSIENIDDNILKEITIKQLKDQKTDLNENYMLLDKSVPRNNIKNKQISVICANLPGSDDINSTSNKKPPNDKNNNNTVDENVMPKTEIKEVSNKPVSIQDKPKPMPRNTKVERSASERKRKPIPIPEPPPNAIIDQLLTPTKKNCIETWLQRSEAEMNNKTADKLEETTVPEILPRLIDFVPKTQFVENSNETQTCIRPTTAPPPPPVDAREDGSGASLDTIGELEESSNGKRLDNDSLKRKSSYDKAYWNERLNRSDTEDKSLSNDEASVPTCPRQPPDGVETPSDAIEKIPDLPTRLPPRLPSNWPTSRTRFSYTSRIQDARSEASVKDKIAMFSSDRAVSSDRLDKCGTLPVRSHSTIRKSVTPCVKNYTDISLIDKRLTKSQDNLDESPRTYKRHTERPEVLGGGENTIIETKPKCIQKEVLQKPLFYGSTNTLASDVALTRPVFHGRSISDDNSSKHLASHKSNLEYLIEQRKKSMSKLRGLVIPEMQAPIVDLPEIKVKDNLSKIFLQKSSKPEIKNENKVTNVRPLTFNDGKWKTNFIPNNLPKYSPAFKRKSLQVYTPTSCLSKESSPERKFAEKVETINKINNVQSLHKPLRASSEITRTHYINSPHVFKHYDKTYFNNNLHNFKNVEVKICTTTEVVDSDNDSAMSSTQSSYRSSASSPMQHLEHVESDSSRMSPKVLHYATYVKSDFLAKPTHIDKNRDEYIKRKVCRSVSSETNVSLSSSAGSGATSGSQASCSSLESSVADSDKRRVSLTYNVDTINRRNILASAKCRSGRDAKLKSPVIETKYSHESHDRSPSPLSRPPERLSTLPSNVSVITNKGDSRRRNKLVVESDSDSESEIDIRQRKSDFKNSRLKRNSSANNKIKQNGVPVETDKNEEVPQLIKDKIISAINKAGLDDCNKMDKRIISEHNKVYSTLSNNNYRIVKNEEKVNTSIQQQKDLQSRLNVNPMSTLTKSIATQLPKNNTQQECKDITNTETQTVRLKKENGSGVGLILAGGTDCEAKDVTVHRVLSDSIAAKAGIKKGTKIKSINGSPMTGLTHAQSVSILKEQRSEVIIEIETERKISKNCGSDKAVSKATTNVKDEKKTNTAVVTVLLEKAGGGAGLGFGLDGGRDSPNGDKPLTVKKLFAGGAAAQSGRVLVGAELLSAGGQSFEGFTRTQAWAALKALPSGQVALVLKNPIN